MLSAAKSNKKKGAEALTFIEGTIIELKRRFKDPYMVVTGDFNQWDVGGPLSEFRDFCEAPVGNTRKDRCLDRMFLNMGRSIQEAGTFEPLETEGEGEEKAVSDHRVAYCRVRLERKEVFVWESYTYRHFNDQSVEKFKAWLVMHEWKEVCEVEGSDAKAEAYQATIDAAIESCFPLKTTHRKNTDLPWMCKEVLKEIERRKRIYVEDGGQR